MFKKLFGLGSKTNEETIVAPLTGAVKNIEEVPDPVFFTAPVNGATIVSSFVFEPRPNNFLNIG